MMKTIVWYECRTKLFWANVTHVAALKMCKKTQKLDLNTRKIKCMYCEHMWNVFHHPIYHSFSIFLYVCVCARTKTFMKWYVPFFLCLRTYNKSNCISTNSFQFILFFPCLPWPYMPLHTCLILFCIYHHWTHFLGSNILYVPLLQRYRRKISVYYLFLIVIIIFFFSWPGIVLVTCV